MAAPPSRTASDMISVALLYSPLNDVSIFVEDITQEHLHLAMFRKLLGPKVRIERVFGLGGKRPVLDQATKYSSGQWSIPGPCFFVVDRDLDPFLGLVHPTEPHVIVLREYCVENYLVAEQPTVMAVQWKLKEPLDDIRSRLQFETWLDQMVLDFFPLFVAFTLCRYYELGENAELSPYKFIEDRGGYRVSQTKFERYMGKLQAKYAATTGRTLDEFNADLSAIRNTIEAVTGGDEKSAISGKYFLTSLRRYASALCDCTLDEELFLGLMVTNGDFSALEFARQQIADSSPDLAGAIFG